MGIGVCFLTLLTIMEELLDHGLTA